MTLDRAAHLRDDAAALDRLYAQDDARVTPVWRNRSLVEDGGAGWVKPAAIRELLGRAPEPAERIFLGLVGDAPRFTIDLSALDDVSALGRFQDLRMAGAFMDPAEFTPLAYARGMTRFLRKVKHCSSCGGELSTIRAGFAKRCASCSAEVYPRVDPAVMMLVVHEDRCLLARQPRFPPKMVSALAGFVEPGESVEQCVRRETLEEVGLPLRRITYVHSQGWPFPRSLMLGYECEAEHTEFVLDDDELESARWYSRDELAKPEGFFYPPPMSLAHHLVKRFLAAGA